MAPLDAVGVALERQRPALQVREDEPGHGGVIGDQIPLGEAALREQHLVPVGELQSAPAGQHHELAFGQPLHLVEQRLGGVPGRHGPRRGRVLRRLQDHLARLLVLTQALERRRPHDPVTGPLAQLDLGHQARLHEPRVAGQLGPGGERGGVPAQWSQARLQVVEHPVGEAGAHPAGIDEVARGLAARSASRLALLGSARVIPLVITHEQGPDPLLAPSLAGYPAADHQLLAPGVLDLHPRAAATSGLIDRVEPLGHHPLQALGLRGLQQRLALPGMGARNPPGRTLQAQGLQRLAPLGVGLLHQRPPVHVQQVEDRVHHRHLGGQPPD